jgi:hypothetical protein
MFWRKRKRMVTLEQLTEMVADLAEEVALGHATHTRPAYLNKSLAVLHALRPESPAIAPVTPDQMCMKRRVAADEDSEVCLKPRTHVDEGTGHMYGPKPRVKVEEKEKTPEA